MIQNRRPHDPPRAHVTPAPGPSAIPPLTRVRVPDGFHTPLEAVGPVVEECVVLPVRSFHILRPAEPDRLLEHPAVLEAFQRDEYMPYWSDLWPAARMLAKVILQTAWPRGLQALELGCGLGLAGVAALAQGLRVTFSDYDTTALSFAARNAERNGFPTFELLYLDWRQPPERRFPLILASDLLYERRHVTPLVLLLQKMLTADGLCLLTDQDRAPASLLRQALEEHGFTYSTGVVHAGQPGLRVRGTLYRIQRVNRQ